MVLFNYSTKEITAKIVYYGPGLCGKTTNLQFIHSKLDPGNRGKLLSLATESDRTLFFDFLPLDLGKIGGFHVRFQLYTVPGQVHYNATRRMVLKGVDAVVFVADSQAAMLESNRESFHNLKENLVENGYHVENIPVVLQANKRDLPKVSSLDEIVSAADGADYQVFEAVACQGDGVFETLRAVIKLAVSKLQNQFQDEDLQEPALEGFLSHSPAPRSSREPEPLFSPDTPMMEGAAGGGEAGAVSADPAAEVSEETAGEVVEEVLEEEAIPGEGEGAEEGGDFPDAGELNLEDEISLDDALDDDTMMEEIVDGKAVEELDLDQFERPEPPAATSAEPQARDDEIASLASRVEDLAREVSRLKGENGELREMVERILSGIGRQIEVLGQIASGRGDRAGENGSPGSGTPPPETGR